MQKLRLVTCLFFISLLVFPVAEKARHELKHLHDHCDSWHTHFCAEEHNCDLCDYLFSSSAEPERPISGPEIPCSLADVSPDQVLPGYRAYAPHSHFLRGPPRC